ADISTPRIGQGATAHVEGSIPASATLVLPEEIPPAGGDRSRIDIHHAAPPPLLTLTPPPGPPPSFPKKFPPPVVIVPESTFITPVPPLEPSARSLRIVNVPVVFTFTFPIAPPP